MWNSRIPGTNSANSGDTIPFSTGSSAAGASAAGKRDKLSSSVVRGVPGAEFSGCNPFLQQDGNSSQLGLIYDKMFHH